MLKSSVESVLFRPTSLESNISAFESDRRNLSVVRVTRFGCATE
jgi:hypothetical protein